MGRLLLSWLLAVSWCPVGSRSVVWQASEELRAPGPPPGPASSRAEDGRLALSNAVLELAWGVADGHLRPELALDRVRGTRLALDGEAFVLELADGSRVPASSLVARGPARTEALAVLPDAARAAEHHAGKALALDLAAPDGAFAVRWRASLRDGSNAVQQEVAVRALAGGLALERLVVAELALPGARTVGSVPGSPVVLEPFFLAALHPMAENGPVLPTVRVGTWSPDEVAEEERTLAWDVTDAVRGGGTFEVRFQYLHGEHRLDVLDVAVIEDERQVARDTHHGHTGVVDVDNVFVLEVPSEAAPSSASPGLRLTARVSADGGHDSTGEVLLARRVAAPPVRCAVPTAPLEEGEEVVASAVLGVVPPGQLRRGFLAWLERERAHPYRPFLHYNSWYDLGFFSSFDEADALGVIEAYGRELVTKRSVVLDSFLMDDGWDDHASLWAFHDGFPRGFAPLREAAARYGAAPGVWFSPWGGYGKPRQERLAAGRAAGYETNEDGFVLAAPRTYARIREVALGMLREGGVNQLKLDGVSRKSERWPGSPFASDFQAAIALIGELRAAKPDVFVNLTTGTWPSPFWLLFADSIWRGGHDHEFAGVGSDRQRWMTYRDGQTHANVVRAGPLFPLSSLMVHGVIHARHARQLGEGTAGPDGRDLCDELRTAFGMGTELQELYVTPSFLDERAWDELARCARWSRANRATLRDTHWIGGDPLALEPYGWAAWSPEAAIVTLRNPSDAERAFTLEPGAAFELPPTAPRTFRFTSPFPDQRVRELAAEAGTPVALTLQPFEVLVLEARADALRAAGAPDEPDGSGDGPGPR